MTTFEPESAYILLKYAALFFNRYPSVPLYLYFGSNRDIKKIHEEIFVKKCESDSDKLHSALYNLPLAGTSHIKCISVFILCTLYSSDHFAFWNFELNEQLQEGNCSDVTMNDTRI